MQVDIGNDKICHNFPSIVASAEIRDLNARVQLEHPQEGSGAGLSQQQQQRRVDPNASVLVPRTGGTSQTNNITATNNTNLRSRSARRNSLNLSRSSAGSRHSQQQHQQHRHHHHHHNHRSHSTTPDEAAAAQQSLQNISADNVGPSVHRPGGVPVEVGSHSPNHHTPMAAVASPNRRQSGAGWSDAVRNSAANGSAHAAVGGEANEAKNGGNGVAVDRHGNAAHRSSIHPSNNNNNNGDDAAAGSQDNNNNNGSGNGDKPAQPAGPKLAQTKIQLGMRLRRWLVINRIGAGSFGETFTAMEMDGPIAEEDTLTVTPENLALLDHLPPLEERREVCIKVEQENKNVLRLEALALKKVQPCPQVVRYLGSGCTNGMNYLVMEKLGPNLAELRRRSQHGTFNIYTTLKAGISCLTAIRGVHDLGLVHRDIKPSNFVTGLPSTPEHTTCYLIDFGLARRFRRSNGEIRPPRDNAGFRGTSRYASVASHHHQELGRVDDLWSLLFMLVEFATGTLPWRKYKDKDDIGRCKEESITPHLVRNLPREFQPFLAHLQTLRYEDEPDYDLLVTLMHRALERRGYPPNKPVEWELDPSMIDSGMDIDGHDGERAGQPNGAAAPSPAQQQQQQPPPAAAPQPQQSPQDMADGAVYNSSNGAAQPPRRVAPQQPAVPDTAAKKSPQLPRTAQGAPSSPPHAPGSAAGSNNNRSSPAPHDAANGQGSGTPMHPASQAVRVSEVEVMANGGLRAYGSEAVPSHHQPAPLGGSYEEPGGASGFPAEGSDTPGADESSAAFDPNEFSPREQPSPANRDRDSRPRPHRPSSAPAGPAAGAAPLPPPLPVEPSNSNAFKDSADRHASAGHPAAVPAAAAVGGADAHSEVEGDAAGNAGIAQTERPMGGPMVDLDAPNNDEAPAQQQGDGKRHPKKKKSNCDCAVM